MLFQALFAVAACVLLVVLVILLLRKVPTRFHGWILLVILVGLGVFAYSLRTSPSKTIQSAVVQPKTWPPQLRLPVRPDTSDWAQKYRQKGKDPYTGRRYEKL